MTGWLFQKLLLIQWNSFKETMICTEKCYYIFGLSLKYSLIHLDVLEFSCSMWDL